MGGSVGGFCVPDGCALLGGLAEEEADLLERLCEGELGGHFGGEGFGGDQLEEAEARGRGFEKANECLELWSWLLCIKIASEPFVVVLAERVVHVH